MGGQGYLKKSGVVLIWGFVSFWDWELDDIV